MIKTLLPTVSPCMRTGLVIWGAVAVLMGLLLWASSATNRSERAPTTIKAQEPNAEIHAAVKPSTDVGR